MSVSVCAGVYILLTFAVTAVCVRVCVCLCAGMHILLTLVVTALYVYVQVYTSR